MKVLLFCVPLLAIAASAPEAVIAPRTTPPTIATVAPQGAPQGATTTLKIDGSNLTNASAAFFSQAGINARIAKIETLPAPPDNRLGSAGLKSTVDLGPVPQRNVVSLEIDVDPDVELGPVSVRLQTPLGLTTAARFVVEPHFPEAKDKEPNDDPEHAIEAQVPSILVGAISKPGDVDYYKFDANAGDRLVFQNDAMQAGSVLRASIAILDADHHTVHQFSPNTDSGIYAHEFAKAGTYYLKITDFEKGGSARHFYRMAMGKLPVVLSTFPLAVMRGAPSKLTLTGWNLKSNTVDTKSEPAAEDVMMFRPQGALNKVKVAINDAPASASIDGHLTADHLDHRFHASKGQDFIVEVIAARFGSPLDSVLEVLDGNGKPMERATVRAITQNYTTLNDRDSMQAGLRLLNISGFAVGDYMMVGSEIVRVAVTPHGPDEDTFFETIGGQRVAYFDTSSEGHAMDSPVYKVQLLPPGAHPPANGLPLVHLTWRNDDGGPGYGKDSLIHFTAPADGDYVVRLSDARGRKGEEFTYRLNIRAPQPHYQLALKTAVANVPVGGRVPVTVGATRFEGYDAPIHLAIKDLPEGLHATDATIPSGETSGTLVLSADAGMKLDAPVPLIVKDDKGREASPGDRLRLIALTSPSDIQMSAKTREVVLTPGSKGEITVDIHRSNGFAGRVPVEVRDLPQEIVVSNVGLNGVLINETESTRTFAIEALPNARPGEQTIVVSGKVETRAAGQENAFSAEPIRVVVKPAH